MAHGFERFGLPPNLHEKTPHKFYYSRTNRRAFFFWLAHHMCLPLPNVDQNPWYQLQADQIYAPIDGERPFGNNLLNWDRINPHLVRHYALVIIDAFPEVSWDLTMFQGRLNQKKGKGHLFTTGYYLPSPSEDVISRTSPVVFFSGPDICRPYICEIEHRLGIQPAERRQEWSQRIMDDIASLNPPMRKWEGFRQAFNNSLYAMLSTNFPEVGYRPWEVGGNTPVGFGNPSRVGEEQARSELRWMLQVYVSTKFSQELEDENLDILYDIGQRGLNEFNGVCKNHFRGSPQELIQFAYPDYDWDPTRFGLNKERQRRVYHLARSWMTDEELHAMGAQSNEGWEQNLSNLFGVTFPTTSLQNGHSFGGNESYITADILVMPRLVMLDVLGEDHTDPTLRRSNRRSMEDVHNRFHQRWIQDRQRWNLCWANNISTIAIGPEFQFTEDEIEQLRAVFDNLDTQQPSFHHLGFPEDYEVPELGPNGIDVDQPLPTHYNLGTQATSTVPSEAEVA